MALLLTWMNWIRDDRRRFVSQVDFKTASFEGVACGEEKQVARVYTGKFLTELDVVACEVILIDFNGTIHARTH